MPIRILIADDHAVVRSGLRTILESEPTFEIVGEADDGVAALEQCESLLPDIVLLDITMPPGGGFDTARQLQAAGSSAAVVFLTVHEDEELLREALTIGAAGYVVKRAEPEEIVQAVQAAHRGDLYVHPRMTRGLVEPAKAARGQRSAPEELTPREVEVLELLVQGHTNREAAGLLGISIRTVENHRSNLQGKLGLSSRAELVDYAREQGLFRIGSGLREPGGSGETGDR